MSEALKLAEWLDKCEPNFYGESSLWLDKVLADNVMYAAIELRRLDAENVRLQAAVAAARAESDQAMAVLRQIAAMPRKTREQRFAKSCVDFLEAIRDLKSD